MGQETISIVDRVVQRYGAHPEALVEVLRDLSKETGYLSKEMLEVVARRLGLPQSQVLGVASFYSMINVEPRGRHVVLFCQDAPCHIVGGKAVWEALERELGIPFGATTPDGEWSLLTTSCIGACSVGPVMMVDDDIFGNLTPEKVHEILGRYRSETAGGAE
jgi:NADH:ubiquinone oxidoreductase subunit E